MHPSTQNVLRDLLLLISFGVKSVQPNNAQGEYYLTDCAEILRGAGHKVLAVCNLDITEAMGVNTQEQLAEVQEVMLNRGE